MSIEAMTACWGRDFPAEAEGLSPQTVRLVALAVADVVNDAYDWRFFARRKHTASKVGCHPDTVSDVMAHLVEAGVIEVLHRDEGKPVEYRWLLRQTRGGSPHPPRSSTAPPAVDDRTYIPIETEEDLSPPSPSRSEPRDPNQPLAKEERADDFRTFWEAYPKKNGRYPAEKAWVKQLGRLPDIDVIIGAVAQMSADAMARNTSTAAGWQRFVPQADRWLNDQRWRDFVEMEIEQKRSKPTTCIGCGSNDLTPGGCRGVEVGLLGDASECQWVEEADDA